MPEYGVCTSRVINVKRTPGSGSMPNMRSTPTWEWPAPSRTTSLITGVKVGVTAQTSSSGLDRRGGEPRRHAVDPQRPAQPAREHIDGHRKQRHGEDQH